jgi:protein gp37
MSERSAIEWTEATWNPWMGCTKVSAGCDNCYMFTEQRRYGNDPEVVRRSKTKFGDPLKWKEPKLIFTCSWSDWFHKDADHWRDEAWDIIRRTPQHTYQILTKRPGRIARHLPADWGEGYPNVWLGTSVEDQAAAFRAWQLGDIPARVRFLSCEPLLGRVDFGRPESAIDSALQRIHWLIVGGESGPTCRPMDMDWVRWLATQARMFNVAFFLKQLGGFPDKRGHEKAVLDGERYIEMPQLIV